MVLVNSVDATLNTFLLVTVVLMCYSRVIGLVTCLCGVLLDSDCLRGLVYVVFVYCMLCGCLPWCRSLLLFVWGLVIGIVGLMLVLGILSLCCCCCGGVFLGVLYRFCDLELEFAVIYFVLLVAW